MTKKIKEIDISSPMQNQIYTPNTDAVGGMNFSQFADFPYIDDPNEFVTHRALENWIREQNPGEEPPPDTDPSAAGGAPDNALADAGQMDPSAGGMDPSAGGMGMDPSMGGMVPLTSSQIGRVYELKKIYSRLTAIESFLSRTVDQSMLALRKYVAQAIDLFEVVISNMQQYQEKVDDIIVTYYKFLDIVYSTIRKYFSEEH